LQNTQFDTLRHCYVYRHYYESVNGGEPACIDDQIPFDIPDSWEWVRLGEILSVITDGTHKTPTYVEKGIPFLSVQNISSGSFTLSPLKFISPDEHAKLSARVSPQIGDVLVCRIGTLGKAIVNTLDFEFSIFVSLGLLRPLETSLSDYLTFLINSPLGENWIDKNKVGGGTHTYKINLTSFPSMLIPLPPIREQQRISSAIEIFLEKVTKYAQIEQKLTTLDTTFSSSLKKSILQHAIQGKLVPQDPNDEPASVLLERIAEERAKLGKKAAKSMSRIERRDRGTYEIFPDGSEKDISGEIPFDIPDSWEWCRLEHIALTNLGKTLDKAKNKGELHSYLCSINVYWDGIDLSNLKQARFEPDELNKYAVLPGDLLICEGGDVGRAAIWAESLPMCYQNALHRVRPYGDVSTYFLKMIIEAYKLIGTLDEVSKGMTIKHLVQTELKRLLIPVPSISEQHRIVEKLGVLMKELGVTK